MAGIYIHIPFCRSKCAYCDFYSTPRSESIDAFVDTLATEVSFRKNEIDSPVTTLYLGGGTPSLLTDSAIERIINLCREACGVDSFDELTIEANPEDISNARLDSWMKMGINRVSIGIQSFNDTLLEAISRRHDAASARNALDSLRRSGINYSADLIFGLPGEDMQSWKSDLTELMKYRPPHFSAYLLSYEPGTKLYARLMAGKVTEAEETLVNQMYETLIETAAAYGYRHYEISNYALPGFEAKHNSSYWDMTPYVGLGPAAHSFDGRLTRRANPRDIRRYISALSARRAPFEVEEECVADRFNDVVITSLRRDVGLDLAELQRLGSGYEGWQEMTAEMLREATMMASRGELTFEDGRIAIPERRWLTADSLLRRLIQ